MSEMPMAAKQVSQVGIDRLEQLSQILDGTLDEIAGRLQPILRQVDTPPAGSPTAVAESRMEELLTVLQYRVERLQDINRRIIL
jgi:hypothetical protein